MTHPVDLQHSGQQPGALDGSANCSGVVGPAANAAVITPAKRHQAPPMRPTKQMMAQNSGRMSCHHMSKSGELDCQEKASTNRERP